MHARRPQPTRSWPGALLCALLACGDAPRPAGPAAGPQAPADAARCADHEARGRAYFGELHLHSAHSLDAYLFDTRASADDAYRFARGEAIGFAPLDADGRATRRVRLERPLDFAAVTDHAEYLGPLSVCTTPGSPAHDTARCATVRGDGAGTLFGMFERLAAVHAEPGRVAGGAFERSGLSPGICGDDGERCREGKRSVWREIREATERHDAPCRFTAFHGYEYSASPEQAKVHRNVIFRNATVPDLPVSALDEPSAPGLWRALLRDCNDAGTGCEALSIPHNPNLSNGRMFTVPYRDLPLEAQRAEARLRARLEPLVEIMQIKGDSECRNGMYQVGGGRDELCEFEKLRQWWTGPPDCGERMGGGAMAGTGCQSRLDFVRYTLIEGLREADRIGVNPYRLGITASTDAHNANPGDVQERSFDGWAGSGDATAPQRLAGATASDRFVLFSNPGGLIGVWAEQNTRDSLFDAMLRRETFGTSGPRIEPRFFGGWDYPGDLCAAPDLVERARAGGVAMGSDLSARPGAAAPVFVVTASRDPGTAAYPGGLLQRIQVIKGWVGDDGHFWQSVHDVAGRADAAASVDPETCAPRGPGADALCGVWRDPDFDPQRRAVYYARVVENPSCRWSAWQCLDLPAGERPASCSDPAVPRVIQERAWTSPIWYAPGG